MLSITPQVEGSELDDLKHRLKVVEERLASRRKWVQIISYIAWLPIIALIIQSVGLERWGIWGGLTLLYLIAFSAVFLLIQSRTQLHTWSNRLKDEITAETDRILAEKDRILAETEALAIEQISKLKEEIRARRLEMLSIEDEIKYKRKWRWEFDDFPEILEKNANLDRLARNTISQIARNLERLREDRYGRLYRYLHKLPPLDTWTGEYLNYFWLRWRFDRMQAWQPPDRTRLSDTYVEDDIYDDSEEAEDKARFTIEAVDEEIYEISEEEPSTIVNRPNEKQETQPQTRTRPSGQSSLFDELSLTEKPVAEVPHQRQRLPRYGPIKISDSLRSQINENKMRIGWLGELAIVEFETQRLSRESSGVIREIVHTSVENDAAGYDVQSWSDSNEIYIEVKTTVGDFWSNLYFTQNEFEKMQHMGESYYLYRICKFKVDSGEGSLFIYRGAEMIMETFEFNSRMYVLSEKHH